MAAIPAVLLSLTVGGALTGISQAAECSQGGGTPNGQCSASVPAGFTGTYHQPSAIPGEFSPPWTTEGG